MPPTRREQLELDELLSDIYLGIETLPDRSSSYNNNNHRQHTFDQYQAKTGRSVPNQYQAQQQQQQEQYQHKQPQSLASIVTSTTPRRVRIVEPPDKRNKNFDSSEHKHQQRNLVVPNERRPATDVKYVNTNKLIYHQERNPDDDDIQNDYDDQVSQTYSDENNNDDDLDGVTRVEYYHTTWLDRQLGRASKRRSSKELNERQVKEKAMIEELKRSLKNGAITLRQSFKGKKNNHNKSKLSEIYDDQLLNTQANSTKVKESSSVIGSGLVTVPRNYNQNYNKSKSNQHNNAKANTLSRQQQPQRKNYQDNNYSVTPKQTIVTSDSYPTAKTSTRAPTTTSTSPIITNGNFKTINQPMNQIKQQEVQVNYSRTLPHNYQSKRNEHQLLQSHYRGGNNFSNNSLRPATSTANTMRENYNTNITSSGNTRNPNCYSEFARNPNNFESVNTIGSIPSATEVVRSALSRSNSQASLNQLNKTINLLPTSPSPYNPSPMTPTQQLKPATPSLSPSPIGSPQQRQNYDCTNVNVRQSNQQQQQQQQPVYANPHASLMQHRYDEQMRKSNNNTSIREFNELDSLLRSLSPSSTAHITPGFSSKSTQPSFGFGFTPVQQPTGAQQQQQSSRLADRSSDLYAKVQKQQQTTFDTRNQPQHDNQQTRFNTVGGHQEQDYTIDVTNKRNDDTYSRQQNLSEFEPKIEMLPSMEDYQNISKLNPVKNHYWYKPNMSRDRAIALLKDKPQGTFIVRDSTSFRGAFGLAVKVSKLPKNVLNNANLRNPNGDLSSELIRHFLIEPTSGGVRLKGYANEPVFGSLPALIYQHSLFELALPCKLVIPRADIESPNFNYKQKEFFDEFVASKERAKHPCYEDTSPNNGYRKYPGDVYVHNEHRIIFE